MAVDQDGDLRRILDPLRDQERRTLAARVREDLAVESKRRQERHQFVVNIAAQRRGALRLLTGARDRNAATKVGQETTVVEMAMGSGDGAGATHGVPARGSSASTRRAQ